MYLISFEVTYRPVKGPGLRILHYQTRSTILGGRLGRGMLIDVDVSVGSRSADLGMGDDFRCRSRSLPVSQPPRETSTVDTLVPNRLRKLLLMR